MTVDEAGARYHALDAVRGGALLLGVGLHGAMSFIEPQIWIVKDPASAPGLAALFYVIHMFRMSLFVLLAGFFARLLYQRRGVGGFVKNRLARVATPLGVFWFPCLAAIIAIMIMAALKANPQLAGQPAPPPPPLTVQTFPLTHLWFLYVLLLLYAVWVPLRGILAAIDCDGTIRRGVDAILRLTVRWGLAPVLFGLPLFLVILEQGAWLYWFGIPTPDTGLAPNALAATGFSTAFVVGWLLHRNADLLEVIRRQWWLNLIAAVAFAAYGLWSASVTPSLETVPGASRTVYAGAYVLGLWCWCLGLTGLALRFLDTPSPAWRYVADASYWVYIVHLPLVLMGQYLVIDLPWPAVAKFAAVVAGTLFIALVSYRFGVRYTIIGTILNGKRTKVRKPSLKAQTV